MREFFFSTRLYKQLPSTESDIQKQLEILEKVITKISEIDPIFMTWYINNSTSSPPPWTIFSRLNPLLIISLIKGKKMYTRAFYYGMVRKKPTLQVLT